MEPNLGLLSVCFPAMIVGTGLLGAKRLSANVKRRFFTGPVRRELLLIAFGLLLVVLSYLVPL